MACSLSVQFPAGQCLLPAHYKKTYTTQSPSKRCELPISVSEILRAQVEYTLIHFHRTLSEIEVDDLILHVQSHQYVRGALRGHIEAKEQLAKADSLWGEGDPEPLALYQERADSALARLLFQVGRVVSVSLPLYNGQVGLNLSKRRSNC
jgi:hypothetical protein